MERLMVFICHSRCGGQKNPQPHPRTCKHFIIPNLAHPQGMTYFIFVSWTERAWSSLLRASRVESLIIPSPYVHTTFLLVHFPAKWLIPKATGSITPQTSAFFEINCFERKIYETVSYFFFLSCNLWTIERVEWQMFHLFRSHLQFYKQVHAIFSNAVRKLDITCMQEKYVYPLCNYWMQELHATNCMQ